MNSPVVTASISRGDLKNTLKSYKKVLKTSAEYRKYLKGVSKYAKDFAAALHELAIVAKGVENDAVVPILKYAEMQTLFANSITDVHSLLEAQFDAPLRANYENHKNCIRSNDKKFAEAKTRHTKELKKLESLSMKQTKNARTHIDDYQGTLRELSRMATSLEVLKNENFDMVISEETRCMQFIATKCADMMALESNMVFGKAHQFAAQSLNEVSFARMSFNSGQSNATVNMLNASGNGKLIDNSTINRSRSALTQPPHSNLSSYTLAPSGTSPALNPAINGHPSPSISSLSDSQLTESNTNQDYPHQFPRRRPSIKSPLDIHNDIDSQEIQNNQENITHAANLSNSQSSHSLTYSNNTTNSHRSIASLNAVGGTGNSSSTNNNNETELDSENQVDEFKDAVAASQQLLTT